MNITVAVICRVVELPTFSVPMFRFQFGTLPAELTRKNLEMMASEVMPHFRKRAQRAAAE